MLNADITGFVIAVFILIWAGFTCWLIARQHNAEMKRWEALSQSLGEGCEDLKKSIREQTKR